jgi:precorrin-6Y C5,15-methyltransferase (decarboxylating)
VPGIVVRGRAPAAFDGNPTPDAIFVGGGVTVDGMLEQCWDRLRLGGRLVVNTVTAQGEALLVGWAAEHRGALRRFQIYRAEGVGSMTSWNPKRPITQWSGAK